MLFGVHDGMTVITAYTSQAFIGTATFSENSASRLDSSHGVTHFVSSFEAERVYIIDLTSMNLLYTVKS